MVLPLEDKYSITRNELLDQLAYAMGGRVAEEIVFHDPTTGASNDIEKATATARKMVTEFGMSADVGAVKLGPVAGRGLPRPRHGPPARLLRAHRRARRRRGARRSSRRRTTRPGSVLNENRDILDHLARELLEKETLDHNQIAEIFKDVKKLPERPPWLSSESRPLSKRPPIDFPTPAPIDETVTDGGVGSDTEAPAAPAPTRARAIKPRPATA